MFADQQRLCVSRKHRSSSRAGRCILGGAAVALIMAFAPAIGPPVSASPEQGPLAGSTRAPVVWTGSLLATTSVTSNGDDLLYWWQADGTSTWHEQTVAKNNPNSGTLERFSTPSITWTGTYVVIVADEYSNFEGMGGYGLTTYWQKAGTTKWTAEFSGLGSNSGIDGDASGAQPFVSPQIAWTGSNVVIADVGAVGTQTSGTPLPDDLYFWWQDSSGNFHQETVPSTSSTASLSQAVLTATSDAVVIVAIRNGEDLLSWYQSFGAKNWVPNGIAGGDGGDAFSSPSVAWTGSSVVVAATVVGNNPSVKYLWQSAPGTSWRGQFLPVPPTTPDPSWAGSTAIAWTGSNVDVTAVDSHNNALDFWWLSPGTTTWNPEIVTDPTGVTLGLQPSMTTTTDAAFIVLPESNGLIRWAQDYGTVPWRAQTISP
jgi:hypothetical protein